MHIFVMCYKISTTDAMLSVESISFYLELHAEIESLGFYIACVSYLCSFIL